MNVSPLAGKPADESILLNVPKLITAYYSEVPDPSVPAQRVAFGTSGHRGSAFRTTFNEWHILAISQAICHYRKEKGIDGPLFLGMDSHALSVPALTTTLEVLAANGVEVMLAEGDEYTPTPAISWAILTHNRGRKTGFADGIVITPSHNPPHDGGFKYNPPHGGPAEQAVTSWIEAKANELLAGKLADVKRIPFSRARHAATTHRYDFLRNYIHDLGSVIDLNVIRDAKISMGVDPLGGASVNYWPQIAERYGLNLTVVSPAVDPTFRFMTVDWDGQIRMDPSSPYAMQRLLEMKDRFDVSFACDTDSDRHGIVTRSAGLLPPNHYLSVAIDYLFKNRTKWGAEAAAGKTVVSSQMIDRVTAKLGRKVYEVPVGFKWFVDGLLDGSLGFGGEESAGASFSRLDGSVWTTDKDGIIPALLAAEITARMGRDPGELYRELTRELGESADDRVDAPATPRQKKLLAELSAEQIKVTELAGEKIDAILMRAPGNGALIGGLKVVTKSGWFAARPSGTEEIYKIYAESFRGESHLRQILEEAHNIVGTALTGPSAPDGTVESADIGQESNRERSSSEPSLRPPRAINKRTRDGRLAELPSKLQRIGIAADHGGYELKEYLARMLRENGYEVTDLGNGQPVEDDDYPDFVVPLARAVADGKVDRGIAICGSGVGASVCANKVAGVRACLVHENFSAHQGVEDDDLNLICFGGLVIGHALAWELTETFLAARFSCAERFRRRLAKVANLENKA